MARSVTLGAGVGIGGGGTPSPAPAGQGRRTAATRRLNLAGIGADTFYLWVLLALELLATVVLRSWSRNHHGG